LIAACGAVSAVIVVMASACAHPEQPLLDRFFAASRLRDKTALQQFATVIFEPRDNGIVRTFAITKVAPAAQDRAAGEQVTVSAIVVQPDGTAARDTLVVTLRKGDGRTGYRWTVVGVRDVTGARSAPPL
jgi:hypothetical protein